jgi:flagellar L-ring protein precursor FlgH
VSAALLLMRAGRAGRGLLLLAMAAMLGACAVPMATADRYLSDMPVTSAKPRPALSQPASQGSLFPAAGGLSTGYRPLFEDRRARAVGDTLTVLLSERTTANKKSSASASKASKLDSKLTAANKVPVLGNLVGLELGSATSNSFAGSGDSSATNNFSGTITVTVVEVYANGNLLVAGEKRLAVSDEEEIIRFAGVVNPTDLNANTVSSTLVADARIEYRGRGAADDAQTPGLLTRGVLKFWPF